MTDRRSPVQTTIVRGSDPIAVRLIVLAAVFLSAAILKPWPSGLPARDPRQANPADDAALTAVDRPPPGEHGAVVALAPLPPDAIVCRQPSGWRLISLERWPAGLVRAWTVATPSPAPGGVSEPTGAAAGIPFTTLNPMRTLAIGLCAPPAPAGSPPALLAAAWRLSTTGPTRVAVRWLGGGSGESANGQPLAALYLSPAERATTSLPVRDQPTWPAGRYILAFDVARAGGEGHDRWWLGVEIGTGGPV